ncbi:SEC-C metal-binding domain-containing protein [Colwellia psychrerythraea]|uniref:SEC-C motif domain protein n=1 Tax=Colwellia psychrerythraea TaxID=28229 RepID=A0A099KC92_COLPS|nr:SEC-C metal-binding domain-containing protein [Colwellia psychrerythraea]KGJ88359.1 SEC-C motif domain protein [Colwellia psychrerythraea]
MMNKDSQGNANQSSADETSCYSKSSCCAPAAPIVHAQPKIGRNDPCPCKSGRKFKKCCG